jgi:hypothetical protein
MKATVDVSLRELATALRVACRPPLPPGVLALEIDR